MVQRVQRVKTGGMPYAVPFELNKKMLSEMPFRYHLSIGSNRNLTITGGFIASSLLFHGKKMYESRGESDDPGHGKFGIPVCITSMGNRVEPKP